MFRRHNSFETVLEQCFDRIATGDSVASCLADYPDHAEALRPILEVAGQMQNLPKQQLSNAADGAIYHRMADELRRLPVSKIEKSRSHDRKPKTIKFSEVFDMNVMKRRFVPLGALVAMIAIAFGAWQFFAPEKTAELETAPAAVLKEDIPVFRVEQVNGKTYILKTQLPEKPDYLLPYKVEPLPIETADEVKQLATQIGIENPAAYELVTGGNWGGYNSWVVPQSESEFVEISASSGESPAIRFNEFLVWSEEMKDLPAVPYEDAIVAAEQFLSERDLLPNAYRMQPRNEGMRFSTEDTTQYIQIQPLIDDIPLHTNGVSYMGSTFDLMVAPDGSVSHAQVITVSTYLATDEVFELASAEEAYTRLKNDDYIIRGTAPDYSNITHFSPDREQSPTTHEIGDDVTTSGYTSVYIDPETDRHIGRISGASGGFILAGDALVEMADAMNDMSSFHITGTVTESYPKGRYQLTIADWSQEEGFGQESCLVGDVVTAGSAGTVAIDEKRVRNGAYQGRTLNVVDFPNEILVDETIQLCLDFDSEQDGDTYDWTYISYPPVPDELMSGYRNYKEMPETVALEDVDAADDVVELIPAPDLPPSPHVYGEEVVLEGLINATRYTSMSTGDESLEIMIANAFALLEEPNAEPSTYLKHVFPIYAESDEMLEEIAMLNGLYVRAKGVAVPITQESIMMDGVGSDAPKVAIEIESYELIWEDVQPQNRLASFVVEEIDGNEYVVMTDRNTAEQLVVAGMGTEMLDDSFGWELPEQILLVALDHPEMKIGEYGVVALVDMLMEDEHIEATDVAEFPPYEPGPYEQDAPSFSQLPDDIFTIDFVELRYLNDRDALRPVWVFTGEQENSNIKLEYVIDASK